MRIFCVDTFELCPVPLPLVSSADRGGVVGDLGAIAIAVRDGALAGFTVGTTELKWCKEARRAHKYRERCVG
jgi:hypothetical protein